MSHPWRPWALLVMLVATACVPPDQRTDPASTAVGNPSLTTRQVSLTLASSAEVTFDEAVIPLASLWWLDCDDEADDLDLLSDVWLDLTTVPTLLAPNAVGCGLRLELSDPAELTGTTEESIARDVFLELDLVSVELFSGTPLAADDGDWVVELGSPDWLLLDDLPEEDTEVVVDPEDAAHEALTETLALSSALFADADGDGVREDADATLALAGEEDDAAPEDEPAEEDGVDGRGGGGCAMAGGGASPGPSGVLLVALVGALGGRRRSGGR